MTLLSSENASSPPLRASRNYCERDLRWKGDALHLGARTVARIVPDATYTGMWRIELPNGWRSDLVNRTRAKDAAVAIACCLLSKE
jgi:hypothetical protein